MTSLTEEDKMGETTRLTKATSKSESLRTTVPAGIVKHFGMREGDALDWSIEIKATRLSIHVRHVKQGRLEPLEKGAKEKSAQGKLDR